MLYRYRDEVLHRPTVITKNRFREGPKGNDIVTRRLWEVKGGQVDRQGGTSRMISMNRMRNPEAMSKVCSFTSECNAYRKCFTGCENKHACKIFQTLLRNMGSIWRCILSH